MSVEKYELRSRRYEVEQAQRWQDEVARLPWIQFPSDWKVKVIPPYGDAVVRFLVTLPDGKEKSVYHDSRASLGLYFGDGDELIPYWEVYPVNGDIGRCGTDEVELLLEMIAEGSEEQEDADANVWITDRMPCAMDTDNTEFVYNQYGAVTHYTHIKEGEAWMMIPRPEPYVKPKRWRVTTATGGYLVYDSITSSEVADSIPTCEAAERIAAIYEEVVP